VGCGCKGYRVGADPTKPVLFGEDDGSPAQRVTAVVNGFGIRRGEVGWVTGTGVADLLDAGWIKIAA